MPLGVGNRLAEPTTASQPASQSEQPHFHIASQSQLTTHNIACNERKASFVRSFVAWLYCGRCPRRRGWHCVRTCCRTALKAPKEGRARRGYVATLKFGITITQLVTLQIAEREGAAGRGDPGEEVCRRANYAKCGCVFRERREGKEGRVAATAATAAPKGSLIYLHEAALSLTHSALVFGRTPRSSRAAARRGV